MVTPSWCQAWPRKGYYKLGKLVLNPGLVGLHVLDAFCAGLPMITTADALHSPEFDYLIDGVNGVITPGDVSTYTTAVLELFKNEDACQLLSIGALESSKLYTVTAMAENFCGGVLKCLDQK